MKRNLFKTIAALFLVFLISLTLPAQIAVNAQSQQTCTVLRQQSIFLGTQYLYVSENGLRLVFHGGDVMVISRAPTWNVFVCNLGTGLYYQTTSEGWTEQMLKYAPTNAGQNTNRLWRPSGKTGDVAGLVSQYYTWNIGNTNYGQVPERSHTGKIIKYGYYWASTNIKTPRKAADSLAAIYDLPKTGGIPLKLIYVNSLNQQITALDTDKAETIPEGAGLFYMPRGLKLSSSCDLVMIDKNFEPVAKMRMF